MIDADSHHYLSLSPRTSSIPKRLRLPSYLRIIFIVLTGNVILVIIWLALARTPALPQNPLAAYADVLPGQPFSNIIGHGWFCAILPGTYIPCQFRLMTGAFSLIHLYIVSDGNIDGVSFTVRAHALAVGDLILWWGRPTIEMNGRYATLTWPDRGVTALTALSPTRRFHYLLPVVYIALTRGETTSLPKQTS